MKNTLLIAALLFVIGSCKKDSTTNNSNAAFDEALPVAGFNSNKAAYEAGETIVLTSTSTDANSLRWTLPNGVTSKDESVSYPTDVNWGNTTLNFKLEAISKSGLKSDYLVKAFKLGVSQGQISLYSTQYGTVAGETGVTITIDGQNKGTATLFSNAPSGCSQNGYPNYSLDPGVHTVLFGKSDFNTNFSGSKTVTVTPKGCVTINCTSF